MFPIDYFLKMGWNHQAVVPQPSMVSMRYAWDRMSETVDRHEEGSQGSPQTQWINRAWFHVSCLPAPVAELSPDLTPISDVLSGTMWDM